MKHRAMKASAAVLLAATVTTSANAGCLKGAVVGAIAGHYAHHHAVLGAMAGCAIGHHMAVEAKKQHAAQQSQKSVQPQPHS
ncbi:MAG: hypothetical protein WDM89_19000 [Rhizomicrobium sp.]